ncbi:MULTISPECIES: hypothetical protein [unclassified Sphingomonas]|jgi:hypothetical protein|uniref:hypothetical protein n=1 Tax=unclassified Sphingomonas TaxID=196159 RepID=UPI0025E2FA13|nr:MULTISPECIES: hypothetical protein [unclassified Sphingomonas]
MFTFKGAFAALAGTALLAAPVAASPAPAPVAPAAAKLSIARASAPATRTSKLGASVPGTTLISIGILAALVVGVLVATGGDDDSDSN